MHAKIVRRIIQPNKKTTNQMTIIVTL